jgi:GDP-L-fucose synthase
VGEFGKPLFELGGRRIYIAGHRGMVGSAIVRRLAREDCEILTVGRENLDLRRQADVESWLINHRPDVVVIAAAVVGGIHANATRPAEFIYDNLLIEANLVHGAYKAGVTKLLLLGSNCVYPRHAPQPLKEEYLLTGPLEPTNEWYAIAKIAGIKLCDAYRRQYGCDFISAQPASLYGPFDNFDLSGGHVLPALMRRLHEAKLSSVEEVEIWGSGRPLREFLHVDDLADAVMFLMKHYSAEGQINVGGGQEISIHDLAKTLAEVTGFRGHLAFNPEKPDGMPRKLLGVTKLNALGWRPTIGFIDGLAATYQWFLENIAVSGGKRGAGKR